MSDHKPDSSDWKSPEPRTAGERFDRLAAGAKRALWVIVPVWLLGVVCMESKPQVLIEPVAVPKTLADEGFTETDAQQLLTAELKQVFVDARDTMPSVISDSIEADEPQETIELKDSGISLQALSQYTKRMLGRRDVYIRSALVEAADGTYKLSSSIEDDSTRQVESDTSSSDPSQAIQAGADLIVKARNPFLYASALASRERKSCYLDPHDVEARCDYDDAIKAFRGVLNDQGQRRYFKWSWLALSKIDEDQSDFAGEVAKAMLSIQEDRTFYWGYYNWGEGLAELGCGEQALEAFERTLLYRPTLDFANNAAGRQALDLALDDDSLVDAPARRAYLDRAIGYLMTATEINPVYGEAYTNLGEAILELGDAGEREEALRQFANAILPESPQAKRTIAALKERGLELSRDLSAGSPALTLEALESVQVIAPQCGNIAMARSIRNARGCLSTRQQQIVRTHDGGLTLLTKVPYRADSGRSRDDCRDKSVARNAGHLQPFLLDPMYGVEALIGGKPSMAGL